MAQQKQWYEEGEYFDEEYLKDYEQFLTGERTMKEVEFIAKILGLPQYESASLNSGKGIPRVLDLCCGHGRHSVALAMRGCAVIGVDINSLFLQKAREHAQKSEVADCIAKSGGSIDFVQKDARKLCSWWRVVSEGEFDAVINLFTSFGYFEDEWENQRVLRNVGIVLRGGGKFLIDVINREWIVRNFREYEWEEREDGVIVTRKRSLDFRRSRLHVRNIRIQRQGARKEFESSLRLYTLNELEKMLKKEGMDVTDVLGDFTGSPYDGFHSERMIIVAKRKEIPLDAHFSW